MADLRLLAAPLQGYTECEWRHAHTTVCDGADEYITPFIRVEKGVVRNRDIRDISSHLNTGQHTVAQIIFKDTDEFCKGADAAISAGYREIDMNLGCPFPPQVKHGRGAGMLKSPDKLAEIAGLIGSRYTGVSFSAKMRLGVADPNDWLDIIDIINDMPLRRVCLHPRIAVQQYGGKPDMDAFNQFAAASAHPMVYNGDIRTLADIDSIARLTVVSGIMVGRGLLGRPTLFAEWREGTEWSLARRGEALIEIHNSIYDEYAGRLCGDNQLLMKIKPYWDFAEDTIGHRAAKAIKKATTLAAYKAAVSKITFI